MNFVTFDFPWSRKGLGLGLVISRDIARDFGGELEALPPEPGAGAAFRLTLPRAA